MLHDAKAELKLGVFSSTFGVMSAQRPQKIAGVLSESKKPMSTLTRCTSTKQKSMRRGENTPLAAKEWWKRVVYSASAIPRAFGSITRLGNENWGKPGKSRISTARASFKS